MILTPLISSLTDINFFSNFNNITPYLTIFVSILLISKIPTFSFKKVKIRPKLTIFILFGIGVCLIFLIFFTFKALLLFSLGYFLSIPFSAYFYLKNKKVNEVPDDESHEDVL